MLDPLGFPVFVGIVGGIIGLRYLISKCDRVDNERRILIESNILNNNSNNNSNNNLIDREIPPKYEELQLPPNYDE